MGDENNFNCGNLVNLINDNNNKSYLLFIMGGLAAGTFDSNVLHVPFFSSLTHFVIYPYKKSIEKNNLNKNEIKKLRNEWRVFALSAITPYVVKYYDTITSLYKFIE